MAKEFTIADVGHLVSKIWLRPCLSHNELMFVTITSIIQNLRACEKDASDLGS